MIPLLAKKTGTISGEVKKATDRATSLTVGICSRSDALRCCDHPRSTSMIAWRSFFQCSGARLRRTSTSRWSRPPDLWPVRADPGQIEQVLLNLAINSRDAMPKGGALTFVTENTVVLSEPGESSLYAVKPGEYVLLKVRDTGVGMDEDTQRKIFEPFFTTKEIGKVQASASRLRTGS